MKVLASIFAAAVCLAVPVNVNATGGAETSLCQNYGAICTPVWSNMSATSCLPNVNNTGVCCVVKTYYYDCVANQDPHYTVTHTFVSPYGDCARGDSGWQCVDPVTHQPVATTN